MKRFDESKCRVMVLPSGWWSVWYGDEWVNICCRNQKEAEECMREFIDEMKGVMR